MMITPPAPGPGRIITFYSYKGGTGRTMALANVAWVLASRGQRVLVVDWDFEAPGLHRYFSPFLVDKELARSDGLIDCVIDYATETTNQPPDGSSSDADWARPYANILRYTASLRNSVLPNGPSAFQGNGRLDFLGAGRQDAAYSTKVNTFDWKSFYERHGGGGFFDLVKERMRAEYDFVLIDSRTGASDTSGICTLQMPDDLVVCFTLNNQSIMGASRVAFSALEYRTAKDLRVFPVPTRVEQGEKEKLELRRRYARQHFALLPNHLEAQERELYWGAVEILYVPFYAYEEVLAPFADEPERTVSVLAAAERLTGYLTNGQVSRLAAPDERERRRVLELYAAAGTDEPTESDLDQRCTRIFERLAPPERTAARRLFLRLVRIPGPNEDVRETTIRVPVAGLDETTQRVVQAYATEGFLTSETGGKEPGIQIRDPALVQHWRLLRGWIDEERGFLIWRQQLRSNLGEWENNKRDSGALLSGAPLREAKRWRAERRADLSLEELTYIETSIRASRRQLAYQMAIALAVVGMFLYQVVGQARSNRFKDAVSAVVVADSLADRGITDSALALYARAIDMQPNFATAYVRRGRIYDLQGDTAKALADYNRALQLQDTLVAAYIARARLYLRQGAYGNAIKDFSQGLKRDSTNDQVYVWRGSGYEGLGQHDSALLDYSRALRLQPKNPGAYLGRATVYRQMGRRDSATADYRHVLETYTDIRDSVLATTWLRQLGARPESTTVVAASPIYLQYSDSADSRVATRLIQVLRSRNWKVELGPERVSVGRGSGDVRYFSRENQRQANALASAVGVALAEMGFGVRLSVIYLEPKSYPNARPEQIEVWLPPLTGKASAQLN